MKDDDSQLLPKACQAIHKHADLLLQKADAYGVFPTPINDIILAAQLELSRENIFDKVFLADFYNNLPNGIKLAPDKLKRALGKVIGLVDQHERKIYIDKTTHKKKIPFLSLHEVGHNFLPWQRKTYTALEDSQSELDLDIQDQFEQEANYFSSEVMFQREIFKQEAADLPVGIKTILDLSKKYGGSFYATARRFVISHCHSCALLVFEQPQVVEGVGETLLLRRALHSEMFKLLFGKISWPEVSGPQEFFTIVRPRKTLTPPTPYKLTQLNGRVQELVVEAFDSTYQIFFLLYLNDSSMKS